MMLGVFVMAQSGIKPRVWGQNLAVWLVATILCAAARRLRHSAKTNLRFGRVLMLAAVMALALSLGCPGLDGVHRWLSFGTVRLHAVSIVLPAFLIGLGDVQREGCSWPVSRVLILITAGLLATQPDASEASAFAIAVGTHWFLRKPMSGMMRLVEPASMLGVVIIAWTRSDPLGSVPHVEGIVRLAANIGPAWAAVAVGFLILLPLPFFAASLHLRGSSNGRTALALGMYFAATLLAPAVGHFPVPVMGYGASPILGYFFGLGWLSIQSKPAMLPVLRPQTAQEPTARDHSGCQLSGS
jgi:hypothetical protein